MHTWLKKNNGIWIISIWNGKLAYMLVLDHYIRKDKRVCCECWSLKLHYQLDKMCTLLLSLFIILTQYFLCYCSHWVFVIFFSSFITIFFLLFLMVYELVIHFPLLFENKLELWGLRQRLKFREMILTSKKLYQANWYFFANVVNNSTQLCLGMVIKGSRCIKVQRTLGA